MGIDYFPNVTGLLAAIRVSLQKALLCEVSETMRMVCVDYDDEKKIILIFFYFDGQISDRDRESAFCVAQEASADFDEETQVLEKCIRFDFPERLPTHQIHIYRRRE